MRELGAEPIHKVMQEMDIVTYDAVEESPRVMPGYL